VTETTKTIAPNLLAPEVGTVWDLCLSAEFDRERLVKGLAEWLGSPGDQQVLDCACGTGFPSLDLCQLGYDLTCTDASPLMLNRFRIKAETKGVQLRPVQARWEELGGLYPERFDVVMCRGSSFIYAGTWDSDADPDWSALEASVKSFAACLRPGGRLYIDTTQEEDLLYEDPKWEVHPTRTIDGRQVDLRERVVTDRAAGVRRWLAELSIDGDSFDFERKSHYLPHAELMTMLGEAGLDGVGRTEVTGERYAVFSGHRP
jgi:SAM-dependent methyltransferase